jgi:hypothetical protein
VSENLDLLDELLAGVDLATTEATDAPTAEPVKPKPKRKGKKGGMTIHLSPQELEAAEAVRVGLCIKLKTDISRASFLAIAVMAGVELMRGKL